MISEWIKKKKALITDISNEDEGSLRAPLAKEGSIQTHLWKPILLFDTGKINLRRILPLYWGEFIVRKIMLEPQV